MRVLHWYPDYLAGGSVASVVRGLAVNQARLGTTVAIAAAEQPGRPARRAIPEEGGVSIIEWQPQWSIHGRGFHMRRASPNAVCRLRAFHPDVVHVHGELNPDNLWVPRLFGCPIVLSPHGGFYPEVFRKSRRVAKRLYFRIARHLLYRRIRAFHALSAAEAQHIARLLPNKRVYCVPQGPTIRVPVSAAHTTPSEGRVRFVCVGRLDVFTKGLDILLEAFAEAGKRLDPRPILTLVGPDRNGSGAWLQKRGRELGIDDRIVLTGRLSGKEVASTLNQSDIYVQLSRHDAFSLSVLEALLAGKPTILSNAIGLSAYREVASLPHVRVVPPHASEVAEAMVEFARDLDELRAQAELHRTQIVEFFSWERIAGLQLDMYRQVITQPATANPS